jgi:hypothetical protein
MLPKPEVAHLTVLPSYNMLYPAGYTYIRRNTTKNTYKSERHVSNM